MKGSKKKMWVLNVQSESKRNAQVQTWVTWWWSCFYADDTTLESWANAHKVVNCACTETTACRSVNSSVNNWTETHYQRERQTTKGNCTKTFVVTFSHMLGASNSDSNTVRSLNVSGQWSREFQPLCFPYLNSPDSQSHVLGYSHWTN